MNSIKFKSSLRFNWTKKVPIVTVHSFRCPECNAPIKLDENKCEYCNTEYIITSLAFLTNFEPQKINKYIQFYKERLQEKPADGATHLALGICYIDLGLPELAQKTIKKAIDFSPEISENYFYYAISLIVGKKIKTIVFDKIIEIEKYIDAAINLNPQKASYYYLLAILKYEFHLKNGFRTEPTVEELIAKANSLTYERREMEQLLKRLNIRDERIKKEVLK